MLEKTIAIGDKQVKFRSSATIPRLYRVKFKRLDEHQFYFRQIPRP